ncbi:MAG TPA: hypothetical protein VM659_08295 [Dongiaceae bacterium]|nr:hypothetical protein [Dongiaceae bacterium]
MLIGVDPGIKGALAFFYDDGRQAVIDVPIRAKHPGGNEVDPRALQQMLRAHVPADEKGLVVMESSHAFMGSGKRVGSMASQASLAATKAVIAAVCELSGMDIAYVTPREWQGLFGIRKTESEDTKDQSLRIARELYPHLKLTKTSGRADALLIGRYGQRHFV